MDEGSRPDHWICLAAGNALGPFHQGAAEALLQAGLSVTRIAGACIGAVAALARRARAGGEAMRQALSTAASPQGPGLHVTRHLFRS